MKNVNITDKQFSDYLIKKDKEWFYFGSGSGVPVPYTTYFDSAGKVIALVFYDNQKYTRRIFI